MLPRSIYIFRANYPPNRYDTCGYTAATLMLLYYQKMYGGMIPDEFLDKKGFLRMEGHTLQDRLISYGTKNLSWGGSIARVLNRYFEEYGIPYHAHFRIFGFGARKRIANGLPVILFGNLPGKGDARLNHAVLAYGLNQSKKPSRFIVHYGWKGWEQRVLEDALIGSYVFLSKKG